MKNVSLKISMICVVKEYKEKIIDATTVPTVTGWIRRGAANDNILVKALAAIDLNLEDFNKDPEEFAKIIAEKSPNKYSQGYVVNEAKKILAENSDANKPGRKSNSVKKFINRVSKYNSEYLSGIFDQFGGTYLMYHRAITRSEEFMCAVVDIYGHDDKAMLVDIYWPKLPVYTGIVVLFENKWYFMVSPTRAHEIVNIVVFNPSMTGTGRVNDELRGVLTACTESVMAVPTAVNVYMKKCDTISLDCPNEIKDGDFKSDDVKRILANMSDDTSYCLSLDPPNYIS